MNTILYIFIFIFGTIIGSFLNVVIDRHGICSLKGRSKCDVTGKILRWYELVPVISFLIQGGRSRYSKTKISWQYPLVEIATGLSFVFIAKAFAFFLWGNMYLQFVINILYYFTVFSILIAIFVYDIKHKIIPDKFLFPLLFLAILPAFFVSPFPVPYFNLFTLLRFASGLALALPLFLIFFFSKGRAMGFGDVKLVIPFGWILGFSSGVVSLLLAFWLGAIYGIGLLIFGNKKLKNEIPFAPFLILGFAVTFLYNIHMEDIGLFFASFF